MGSPSIATGTNSMWRSGTITGSTSWISKLEGVQGSIASGADPEFFAFILMAIVCSWPTKTTTASPSSNFERQDRDEIEVGVEPEGVAASPDGRMAAATSETTSMIHMIDAQSLELIDNVLVDTRPRMVQFSPDNKQMWVSSELRGTVEVFDAETRESLATIRFEIPGVPREIVQAVGMSSHPTDRGLTLRWVLPTAWRRSMREPTRCCDFIWWDSGSGMWRCPRTPSDSTPPTAIRMMRPSSIWHNRQF